MKQPFAAANTMYSSMPLPRVTSQTGAGVLGGIAPAQQTIGTRRDFGLIPQFLPWMTIPGGLKQPPRG